MKRLFAALMAALTLGACGCKDASRPAQTAPINLVTGTPAEADSVEPAQDSTETAHEPTQETVQESTPDEPYATPEERAAALLAQMTPEEKAGQVVLGRFPESGEVEQAQTYHLGGYTLFAEDFKDVTPEQAAERSARLQLAMPLGMLLAADEEGGSIVRLSKFPQYRAEPFPAPQDVLEIGGLAGVAADAAEKAALLKSAGLNMNLAPVCDLPRSADDYIAPRAFGTDEPQVSAAVGAAAASYAENGLICTLKHFPGYGDNADTHTGISIDKRPLEELERLDLKPFAAGIAAGAPVVMVSHNIVECLDDSLPASLSPQSYAKLREMGFGGVIMTDDLSMKAVDGFCEDNAAVTAFLAGADLLCCTDYAQAVQALAAAVGDGRISAQRLDESVTRILLMKLEYGIIE